MQRITYYIFRITVLLFSLVPIRQLYVISDGLFYLFFYVVRYRMPVIEQNLRNSFPEKTEKEIKQITKDFYRNFCDILLEGIKGLSMSLDELGKRYRILNPEILTPYFNAKQSVITVGGHYNNWEWSVSTSKQVQHKTLALYKPLTNKLTDAYIKKSRQVWGMYLVSIFETAKIFAENRSIPSIYILGADQSPSRKDADKSFWVRFLNQDTAFLHGLEKYSTVNNYPIFYLDVQRIKRGYYGVTLSLLEPEETGKPGMITKAFARKLESIIRANPANWLWSHKRWKLKAEKHHEIIS